MLLFQTQFGYRNSNSSPIKSSWFPRYTFLYNYKKEHVKKINSKEIDDAKLRKTNRKCALKNLGEKGRTALSNIVYTWKNHVQLHLKYKHKNGRFALWAVG